MSHTNITLTIKKPTTCGECPFYSEVPYECHNERGNEAQCSMEFMDDDDMRDKSFKDKLYDGCGLTADQTINS